MRFAATLPYTPESRGIALALVRSEPENAVKTAKAKKTWADVLVYKHVPSGRRKNIRSYYNDYRNSHGIPVDRCDNPNCQFHTDPLLWNGQSIKMILDRVDGNSNNNRPDNLRYLCPNCDSQSPTRGGKNKNRIRDRKADSYLIFERDGTKNLNIFLRGETVTTQVGIVTADHGKDVEANDI
jgi:5-methylcytosine-specific restriction endonuclease McrA